MSLNLTTADLEIFIRFGVSSALLEHSGVHRVTDAEARHELSINSDRVGDMAGIVFPYLDPIDGHCPTRRLRRDHPDIGADGKEENKYLCPYGDNRHLYLPPEAGPLLADPAVPVVFVEAEKSSLAIAALAARCGRRVLAVGTGGCWSWRGKVGINVTPNGGREEERGPLPDLSLITWERERQAIIVFDSNTITNSHVRAARWAFAQTLVGLGVKVLFVDIPGEGGVNGPDDLINAAGDDAILALLDSARPFVEQVEKDAEEAVRELTKSSTLSERDAALDLVATLSDNSHQRVLTARAATALGERKEFLERDVKARVRAALEARNQAKAVVRLGRLMRINIEPAMLVEDLERFFRMRLQLPNGAETILALFAMNTYLYEVFDTTPYLQIDSATGGCGKTTLLLHLRVTCCRAYLGADPSEAALFRRIDRDGPTWLLDEAAVLHGHDPRGAAIRAILDAGYRKGSTVSRCEGELNELRDFQVFCPKAFALVGSLRGTQLDRCIVIHMTKTKSPLKTKLKFLEREGTLLRDRLEAYAAQYRRDLQELYDSEPEAGYWPDLGGREEELWGPLLTHARLADRHVEKRALEVALNFSRRKIETAVAEDHDLTLSQELKEVLDELETDSFFPSELMPLLAKMESWGERLAACKSDKAKVCAIGRFMNRFRLASRERCRGGTRYKRQDALEVVARHLPDLNATNATNATEAANMRPPNAASPKTKHASDGFPEDSNPVAAAVDCETVASGEAEYATLESRINTGRVACGKSNEEAKRGLLKF